MAPPTKYKPAYCEACTDFMAQGFSFQAFAGKIGTSVDAVDDWANKYPDFRKAKLEGQAKSRLWWETLGRGGAAGKVKGFNVAAWIFNMKNRFGWKDALAISGDAQKPIMVAYDHSKRINAELELSAADY